MEVLIKDKTFTSRVKLTFFCCLLWRFLKFRIFYVIFAKYTFIYIFIYISAKVVLRLICSCVVVVFFNWRLWINNSGFLQAYKFTLTTICPFSNTFFKFLIKNISCRVVVSIYQVFNVCNDFPKYKQFVEIL